MFVRPQLNHKNFEEKKNFKMYHTKANKCCIDLKKKVHTKKK